MIKFNAIGFIVFLIGTLVYVALFQHVWSLVMGSGQRGPVEYCNSA